MKKIFLILSLFVSIVSAGQHKVGLDTNSTLFPGGVLVNTYFRPALDTLASAPVGSFGYIGDKMWFKKTDLFWHELTSGGVGYSNLTEFINQTPHRIFYSSATGETEELAYGGVGTVLMSNGLTSPPSFQTVGAALTSTQVGFGSGSNLLTGASDFVRTTDGFVGIGTAAPVGTVTIWQGTGNKGLWLSGNGKLGGFPNISRAFGMMLGYSDADNVQGMIGSLENYGSSTLGFFRVRTSTFNSFDAITGTGATMNLNIGSGDKNVTIGSDDPASALNKLSVIGRISVGTNVATTVAPTDGVLSEGPIKTGKAGNTTGEFQWAGITSGVVTLKPQAAAGTYTMILPNSNQAGVFTNDGSGNISWGAAGGANALGTYIVQTATNAPANAQVLDDIAAGLIKIDANGVIGPATAGSDYATVSNIHYEIAAKYATTAALASSTYANGTLGVGRTHTATANGAISVDGNTPAPNDRILVKNQATQANNGIFIVTQVGDGSNPFILTGATDHDESIEVAEGDVVTVTAGTANTGTSWYQSTVGTITMGTTAIVFALIPSPTAGLADPGGNGIVVRTALNTTEDRILQGTTNLIDITDGSGVAGDPTFTVGSDVARLSTTQTHTGDKTFSGALQSDRLDLNLQSIATAAGTTTLTVSSVYQTIFTGVTTQTLVLPNATTLSVGHRYKITNNSTGNVTIQTNGAATLWIIAGSTSIDLVCTDIGSAAGAWEKDYRFATITTAKSITFNNSLTFAGTDGTQMTFPSTSQNVVGETTTQPISNKRITKRAPTVTQSATPSINTDVTDVAHITGLAQAITSMTSGLTGTPVEGDELRIDITDNGTARAITWGTSFENGAVALPTTTVLGVRLDILFYWNTVTSKWRCMAAG